MQRMIFKCSLIKKKQCGFKPYQFFVSATLSIILGLLLLVSPHNLQAAPTENKILIVHQKAHGFSQHLIEQLQQSLLINGYQTGKMIIESGRLNLLKLKDQQLLISIGSQTTKTLLEANIKTPILSVLIPRHISKSLRAAHPEMKNWSSLLIDQPIERQFHLITSILGPNKNTGILLGPYTKDLNKKINKASVNTSHNIDIEIIENSDQLTTSLKALNHSVDVLLTLPDPIVYNKNTIRGFLLLAYRNKQPIIGFSKAYVKAGAIAAIYSKPEQISKQILNIANNFFTNGAFKHKNHYPEEFSVALNKNIARSFGIKLKSEKIIIKQIKKAGIK